MARGEINALKMENDRLKIENERLRLLLDSQKSAKDATQALPQEPVLDAVFQVFSTLLFLIGPDNTFLDYRIGQSTELFVPPAMFLGKRVEEVMPPEISPILLMGLERARKDHSRQVIEYTLPTPEGTQYFETQMVPVAGGCIAALVTDITPHKQAQEALRLSEERYRRIVEITQEGIWTIDVMGITTYVNQRMAEIFGYTPEEMVGKSMFEFMDARGLRAAMRMFHRRMKGIKEPTDFRFRHKQGFDLWAIVATDPFLDENGKFAGGIAMITDITERHRAEVETSNALSLLQSVIDSLPAYISYVDSEERYRLVNRQYEAWFQLPKEEIVGRRLADMQPAESYEEMRSYVHQALAGEAVQYERSLTHADQTVHWFDNRYVPHVDEKGAVLGFFVLVFDITEKKRLEEKLLQAQKMESIGRLAGGIAHDFNNLLTAILGYMELVEESAPTGHELLDYLGHAQTAADRARELTAQLLSFARKRVILPRVVDLNALLRETQGILRRLIGAHIEIHIHPQDGLGMVRSDFGQLQQVLINLAVNAQDSMLQGGTLTIATQNVELDARDAARYGDVVPGEYVMLSIRDTGEGMTPEVQSHIFEPFYTTKAVGKGTGLGLAMVYGFVQQSSGHIHIQSEPSKGTVFEIYLPRVPDLPDSVPQDTAVVRELQGRETILLAEDEPQVRALAEQILRSQGYTVLAAANGEEALNVARNYGSELHLLMTDLVMPQIGGLQLAQILKGETPAIKVLFISGYSESVIVSPPLLESGGRLLQKPFTSVALLQTVREVLDST